MSRASRIGPSRLLVGVTALALGGCAVLTIDVDVYKGPLADHEHLQAERVSSLVIAAKPLLVQLRDCLEWPRKERDDLLESKEFDHLDGYMPTREEEPSAGYDFENEQAHRVNALLKLYEDRRSPPGRDLLRQGRDALAELQHAVAVLPPGDGPDYGAIWSQEIEPHTLAGQDARREAYEKLYEKGTSQYLERLLAKDGEELSANAAFRELSEAAVLRGEAEALLAEAGRAPFIQRTGEIARAFLVARQSMHRLAVVVLQGIRLAAVDQQLDPIDRRELTDDLVAAVGDVLQLRTVWLGLDALTRDSEPDPGFVRLRELLILSGGTAANGFGVGQGDAFFAEAKQRLVAAFAADAFETAAALLRLDAALVQREADLRRYLGSLGGPAGATDWRSRMRRPGALAYGIARGPAELDGADALIDRIDASIERLAIISGGTLDRGRLDLGIESTVEHYLEQASRHWTDDPAKVAEARRRMSDILTQFAQKLLGIANNEVLLGPPTDRGVFRTTVSGATRLVIGEDVRDWIRGQYDPAGYTRLLQAVGNSVLLQINEIKERDSHAERFETADRTDRHGFAIEKNALASARAASPPQVLERLLHHFDARLAVPAATDGSDKPARARLATARQRLGELAALIAQPPFPDGSALEITGYIAGKAIEKANAFEGAAQSESDAAKKQQGLAAAADWRTTAAVVDEEQYGAITIGDVDVSGRTPREVVDQVLAALQYQYIEEVRRVGPNAASAQHIQAAYRAARERRASMFFLRPPSAYLRTSFPASTLQGDPGLRWSNMLAEQGSRNVPGAEFLRDLFHPEDARNAAINAEIDKQFWQSINHVRVAGGGDTNYVVAKDDVGNWYVKNYSANPEDIVKSARNLALFQLGAAEQANLLGRVDIGAIKGAQRPATGAVATDTQLGSLDRALKSSVDSYVAGVKSDRAAMLVLTSAKDSPGSLLAQMSLMIQYATPGSSSTELRKELTQRLDELAPTVAAIRGALEASSTAPNLAAAAATDRAILTAISGTWSVRGTLDAGLAMSIAGHEAAATAAADAIATEQAKPTPDAAAVAKLEQQKAAAETASKTLASLRTQATALFRTALLGRGSAREQAAAALKSSLAVLRTVANGTTPPPAPPATQPAPPATQPVEGG